MEQTITIYCKNTHAYHDVPRGISLIELKDLLGIQLPYPIIAAARLRACARTCVH